MVLLPYLSLSSSNFRRILNEIQGEFSKHQKAAITDIFEIINEGHCDLVKFNPSNEEELKLSSTSYLKNIVDDIKEKNFGPPV